MICNNQSLLNWLDKSDVFLCIILSNDALRHIEKSYVTEEILRRLREDRVRRGFSQRELSARSVVPQSHISKIESGGVDLRISSLIALAHVLDL